MAKAQAFNFDDEGSFEENIATYVKAISQVDELLGQGLGASLSSLADGEESKTSVLTTLYALLEQPSSGAQKVQADGAETSPCGATTGAAGSAVTANNPSGWFIEGLEVEGFRGINNEGAPLSLRFKTDCVNSISAPNGVGKSSVYDALSFALTGKIPKLDNLPASERGQDYYLNRFHSKSTGTIRLRVRPEDGSDPVTITVARGPSGNRIVSATDNVDGEALLKELNREFVLLDSHTFQDFIDLKALDRGRTFAGLLGLAQYSAVRQELQALSNTRSFNAHFETSAAKTRKTTAERAVRTATEAIAKDYEALVKDPFDPSIDRETSQTRCWAALRAIPILSNHCDGKTFLAVNLDECIEAIRAAEGGKKKERHTEIIREQSSLTATSEKGPSEEDLKGFCNLTSQRDAALAQTAGETLNELYRLSEEVLTDEDWPSVNLCPTCERDDGSSVLDRIRSKLTEYEQVKDLTARAATQWAEKGWADLEALGKLTIKDAVADRFRHLSASGQTGQLNNAETTELVGIVRDMRQTALDRLKSLASEREGLERELPPSLVAATTAVETGRRLQQSWRSLEESEQGAKAEAEREARVTRLKKFLDKACEMFAKAESAMAAARLKGIEPVCRDIFKRIIFSPVVPSLLKKEGSEELSIRLAEFWSLKDVSAQALLSESFRNAFAVSVYLAAASLYGGAPRFVVLDDVTSSFDAGHQHHLMEVIRTAFARPVVSDGPQLVILSHDTLLEKLFNKFSGTSEWHHQRLEGNAHTAVLLQSGAVNKVRDATNDLLDAGRVDDAAPRIRQYLEYRLNEVIDKCRIPVPVDLAFNDERRTAGEYLKAIEAAVDLHKRAGDLVLEPSQVQNLAQHSATIVGNYLSHWSTGQTQAFSAPALQGVIAAIDALSDCFRYEPSPGGPKRFYKSLSQK